MNGCLVLRSTEERVLLFRIARWAGVPSDPSLSTVEVALLRCFGLDQHAQRSHEALRSALIDAGLPPRATRALIRRSPLLERVARGHYRLRSAEQLLP